MNGNGRRCTSRLRYPARRAQVRWRGTCSRPACIPTLEVMLMETPAALHRQYRPDLGLALTEIWEDS
jgi:predicted DNA-binding protein with PD1-like motif